MSGPSIPGFISFLQNTVGLTTTILPVNSPTITFGYNYAIYTCVDSIATLPFDVDEFLYSTAVYNLGADTVLTWGKDQTGQSFFADYQKQYNLLSLVPGVVRDVRDESTFTALDNPEFFKTLTLQNLQNLKTPYGRQYIQIAQSMGSISLMSMA